MPDRRFRWPPYLIGVIALAALVLLADHSGLPPVVGAGAMSAAGLLLTLANYRAFLASQEPARGHARAAFVHRYALAVALVLGMFAGLLPIIRFLSDVALRALAVLLAWPAAIAGWAALTGAGEPGVPRLYVTSAALAALALGTAFVELALRAPGLHPGFVWLFIASVVGTGVTLLVGVVIEIRHW